MSWLKDAGTPPRARIGKERTRLLIALSAIAVAAVVIVAALAFQPAPAKIFGASSDGFRVGDRFDYDAVGAYKGSPVTGVYNSTITAVYDGGGGQYGRLNSTTPELDALFNKNLTMWFLSGYVIGTGKIATPYGIKEVVQLFQMHDGFAAAFYVGWEPQVTYGCIVNGPDFHLELKLNSTNNPYAIANNTEHVDIARAIEPTPSGPTGVSATGTALGSWGAFYFPQGAKISYEFTANGSDLIAYSEANVRSMADGGPYAYFPALTRIGAGNETGELILNPGIYYLCCSGKEQPGESAFFIIHVEVL